MVPYSWRGLLSKHHIASDRKGGDKSCPAMMTCLLELGLKHLFALELIN